MLEEVYNRIVTLHSGKLYRFLLAYCRERAVAKDAVQEAFMKLWLHRENIEPTKVKTWLYTTGRNACTDWFRRQNNFVELKDGHKELEAPSMHYSDLNERLHQALACLNEAQRTVVLLKDYENYSYEEIAEIMGINVNTAKSHNLRARRILQQRIGSIGAIA